jgi:ligand-binding SRPBCC domain-containing protein
MFRRTFWFTSGVAAGVWATTKVNRKLKQLTPENLAVTAANKALDAGHRIKDRAVGFALDVRDNMAQREEELGDALGLNASVDAELPAPRRYTAIENRNNPKSVGSDRTTYSYNRNEDH